jgi:hypothetical protein
MAENTNFKKPTNTLKRARIKPKRICAMFKLSDSEASSGMPKKANDLFNRKYAILIITATRNTFLKFLKKGKILLNIRLD